MPSGRARIRVTTSQTSTLNATLNRELTPVIGEHIDQQRAQHQHAEERGCILDSEV